MEIREVRRAEPAEWDAIWSQCSYATFFHSREWAEVWRKHANREAEAGRPAGHVCRRARSAVIALCRNSNIEIWLQLFTVRVGNIWRMGGA